MTLKKLEYFLAIAETGNMTVAAKNLNISQPPLSLQIKALEEELDVQLFDRRMKTLALTKAGELLQKRAKQIINLVDFTIYDLQNMNFNTTITLRIGTISSSCKRILPGKIMKFKENYPHVDFQIFEDYTDIVLEQLEKGSIDLGIVREPFNAEGYHFIPVYDAALGNEQNDYFVAIAQEKFYANISRHCLSLIELKDKPLIIPRCYRNLVVEACLQKGFTPHITCESNRITSSINWAATGIGIALSPYTASIAFTSPDMLVKPVVNPRLTSNTYIIWQKKHPLSLEASHFIRLFEK